MNEPNMIGTVGFRHVIEDGLAVLQDRDLDPKRRKYVLERLKRLMQGARKGSELVKNVSLFVRPDEIRAFETYSLLGRYLGRGQDGGWRDMLCATEEAFSKLEQNAAVSTESRATANALLTDLLASVKRRNGIGFPEQPEEIRLSA